MRPSLFLNTRWSPEVRTLRAQGFLASVLQNERNRLAQVRQAFFTRFPLAVRARHFGAIRDVPWSGLLHNRRKLVMHASILSLSGRTELLHPTAQDLGRDFGLTLLVNVPISRGQTAPKGVNVFARLHEDDFNTACTILEFEGA